MKKISLFCLVLCMAAFLMGEVTGVYHGVLSVYGMQIRLTIHLTEGREGGMAASLDSPDQDAYGIEADEVVFDEPNLKISFPSIRAVFEGKWEDDKLTGDFKQAGMSFPMELSREEIPVPHYERPQDPEPPYPYQSMDVTFSNEQAGINLAGTFTVPEGSGKFPGVVLVSGSGAQNRNEELLGHKPFLVLSDYLTRAGIAVLRYDDRGTAESEGDFVSASTLDLATDAFSAVQWLKAQPQISRVGIIGHSEGGIIAPIVASQDPDLAFIVLLAGTGVPGDQVLDKQVGLILEAGGTQEDEISEILAFNRQAYDLVKESDDNETLKQNLDQLVEKAFDEGKQETFFPDLSLEDAKRILEQQLLSPWMKEFILLDPAEYLQQLQIPVLALNGSKDLQVDATQNLPAIMNALDRAGNKQYKVIEYKDLNHLFQPSQTGNPNEYGSIETTFSERVMRDIARWVLGLR